MHNDAASCAEKQCCELLETVASAAETRASTVGFRSDPPQCKVTFSLIDRHVDPHIDLKARLDERHALRHVTPRVEISRPVEDGRTDSKRRHAVKPKGAESLPRQA